MNNDVTKNIKERYNDTISRMNGVPASVENQGIQEDIAWTRHAIEEYGFENMTSSYCIPLLDELESLVDDLIKTKSQ